MPRVSNFKLGLRSWYNLRGVNPRMVELAKLAIQITTVDFTVIDGRRTEKRQRELVLSGASRTMNSKHLTGNAIDVVPYVGGRIRWDWPLFYPIAEAFRQASVELSEHVIWGGCWHVITGTATPAKLLVANYVAARRAIGKDAYIDGPHFEF